MHELSIAEEILATSRRVVDERGGGRLVRVRVAIGELAAIEPDLLRFAWEALVAGGGAGCRFEVEWRPAHQFCAGCGEEKARAEGDWLRLCPDCGGVLEVSGGQELDLLQVEFEPTVGGAQPAGEEMAHG
jgi:hydrogenase nickel incorporation protein HypA/HybF